MKCLIACVTKMNRVYIAGAGGMLGSDMCRVFSGTHTVKASDIDLNEEWLHYADVRNKEMMRRSITEFNPHLIINLAALTDLEYCEEHPKESLITNYVGAKNLQEIAKELNVPYVYISTAGIFGGKKDSYTEEDTPDPTSAYGRGKYSGERHVLHNYNKSYVFRAGWMMGGGKKDKKFIAKILKQIEEGAEEIYAVEDKQGTPTYTLDFSRCLHNAITKGIPYGLYNMVCDGHVSRLDVAKQMIEVLGLDIPVHSVSSDFFIQEYSAPRPACEALVNRKLNLLGENIMRDWEVCLQEYLNER